MARTNRLYEDFLRRTGQQFPPGPNIIPGERYGNGVVVDGPPPTWGAGGELLPGGGGSLPPGGPFTGWNPPDGTSYGPGDAPGYGTSTDPERAGFNLFSDARAWLSRNPQIFNPYGGQMVAGNSPFQQQARDSLSGFLGGDPSRYGRDAAMMAQSAGSYMPMDAQYAGDVSGGSFLSGNLGAYMNPFTDQVVNTALGDIERSRLMANNAGARSAGAGTYGGDRNALIEAETNRAYADQAARTSAQLRSQGFDTAASLMGQDLNRGFQANLANQGARNQLGMFNSGLGLQGAGLRLDAANSLSGIGSGLFGQGLQGASALNQFGTQDQATAQLGLDRTYDEYMRSMYGPMEGYNFLGGLLSGNSYATPGSPGKGRSAMGGALTGAGALAPLGPWGAGIGAAGGFLGGWLFG